MASSWRTLDLDRVQLRTIFARTERNVAIPSSMILIANGNGATHWSSISTILEISSFRTIKGNSAVTFSADMSYNLLQVSTTGVRGTFESYVDSTTSTLMLSNAFPPTGVGQYPGPPTTGITLANATTLAGGIYMNPVEGNSTMKFIGIGDVRLSTVTAANATFFYMSTVTAVGYSTISGETFILKSRVPSTFSTARGQASFVSSFSSNVNWNLGTGLTLPTAVGNDYLFTTCAFPVNHLADYFDISGSTKLFVDYYPNLTFNTLTAGTGLIKTVSTFLSNAAVGVVTESVLNGNMTSQSQASATLSNFFTTNAKMEVKYTTISSAIGLGGAGQSLFVCHRIIDGLSNAGVCGLSNTTYQNQQSVQNSLFVTLTNSSPLY